jgi:hypothetical protein
MDWLMPLTFAFTPDQRQHARAEAFRRQTINEQQCRKSRNNGGEKAEKGELALRYHMLGAAGEMAVAVMLGMEDQLYQETEAKRGSFDLPPNIDIKTRSKHYYDLIVQLDESPDKILVLVTIENRITLIHGWIKAADAMKEQWKKDPAGGRPAYFVSKTELQSLSTLKQCLNAQTLRNTLLA